MRVLFLNDLSDPRIGSSVRLTYQLAAELRSAGHETLLVTAVEDRARATPTEIEGLRVERVFSDASARWRGWTSIAARPVHDDVERVMSAFRPDVVHAHLVHAHLGYESLTRARKSGAGVVFTAHDVMTFCYQKLTCFHGGETAGGLRRDYPAHWGKCIPCQRLRWNPWRNSAIRRVLEEDVHRFTVVSDELGAAIGANGIRVDRTLHNAVRLQASLPVAQAVTAFRTRFRLEGARVITIGGRLHEQKGVGQLLAMLARLAGVFPDLRLLVLGKDDVYAREFEPRARELGVSDRVVATGWLEGPELQAAYAATDVFVTPSICFDTFGLVNLEAMEHAKPVVATSFGGSPEVVEHGVTGFVANPYDVADFARQIGRLLADPDLRRRMGAAGRARLEAHFTIRRLAAECLEEYALARRAAGHAP